VRDTLLSGIPLISPFVGAQFLRKGENSRDLHLWGRGIVNLGFISGKGDVHMTVLLDQQCVATMRNMITVVKKEAPQGAGRCLSDITVNTHHTDEHHRR